MSSAGEKPFDSVWLAGMVCAAIAAALCAEPVVAQTGYQPGGYQSGYSPGGYQSGYRSTDQSYSGNLSPGMQPGGYGTGSRDPRTGRSTTRPGGSRTPYFDPNATGGRDAGRFRDPATGQYTKRPGATPTPAGTPAAGGPLSTRGNLPAPTTIAGGPRPAVSAPRAAAPRVGVTARFSFKPMPDVAVLYLTPFQVNVAVGEEFETAVSIANPGGKPFQTVEATLRYDPVALEPVRVDNAAIEPLLAEPPQTAVYTGPGALTYRARLRQPSTAQAAELVKVRWKALDVSAKSGIRFGSWEDHRTALLDESGDSILGGPISDGTLGMTLQVYSPEQLADGPPLADQLLAGPHQAKRDGVHLRLITNKETIPAHEDFYVGVWFENPQMADVGKVAFKVRFDPNVLEVIDDDQSNWITTGINVFDGDCHEQFPFDIHVQNAVSNDIGLITYAMACTQRRALPERGLIARIRFRPRALAESTAIIFDLDTESDPQATQVTFLGNDVLGDGGVPDDGVENLAVRIVEPQLPRRLVVE